MCCASDAAGGGFPRSRAVIRGLNRMFPMERHNDLFFTMWYGVYDVADRGLCFATAATIPPSCICQVRRSRCHWGRATLDRHRRRS